MLHRKRKPRSAPALTLLAVPLVLGMTLAAHDAAATPVDLSTWTVETSGGPGNASWNLQNPPANDAVLQTVNGNPTVFFSPGNSQGLSLSGKITVQTASDDDFIGFVLGYNSGDLFSNAADYILIDWKKADQSGFFGCTALDGLAISRVTGPITDSAGAWCHDSSEDVTELARASTLGSTGWVTNTAYDFDISFTADNIKVSVNGVQQINLNGTFNDGSFGFYNYSQAQVLYSAIQQDVVTPPATGVPEPASMLLFGAGLAGLGLIRRRKA